MKNEFPRRNILSKCEPAEKAIYGAMAAIETMPADERLTNAIYLLELARNQVADYIDKVKLERPFHWQTGASVLTYLRSEFEKGISEFKIRVNDKDTFYIHPIDKDGMTFDGWFEKTK